MVSVHPSWSRSVTCYDDRVHEDELLSDCAADRFCECLVNGYVFRLGACCRQSLPEDEEDDEYDEEVEDTLWFRLCSDATR